MQTHLLAYLMNGKSSAAAVILYKMIKIHLAIKLKISPNSFGRCQNLACISGVFVFILRKFEKGIA